VLPRAHLAATSSLRHCRRPMQVRWLGTKGTPIFSFLSQRVSDICISRFYRRPTRRLAAMTLTRAHLATSKE
jgi:hypothetical protein